jgi:hypothetical protein
MIPNAPLQTTSTPRQNWSATEIAEPHHLQHGTTLQRIVDGWQKLTSVPDVPANASFYKREFVRKSRLLSTVSFYFSIVIFVFTPCCLFLPNPNITWDCGALFIASLIAIVLNRNGQMIASALILTIGFEVALTVAIFMISPFDETSIQLYDLYIMNLLLAVSLLPARTVFLFALANSSVILTSLIFQPHTAVLNHDLLTQFIPVMIRPIALQFITAGVSYVWVYSTTKAIARADRAEMVAALEHVLNEQKKELEEGIEQILQTHVAVANGNLNARAPLNHDNALWQIARALNTLLVRLQRAVQAERDLQRVEQAVTSLVSTIQYAEKLQKAPRVPFTQTALDPLIAALQGKTLAFTNSNIAQGHHTKQHQQIPPTPTTTPIQREESQPNPLKHQYRPY